MKKIVIFALCSLFWTFTAKSQGLPENVLLTDINGKSIQLSEIVKDGPVVISFWETYCKPCISELDALAAIKEKWSGKVRIIAISVDNSRSTAKVKSLISGKRWPFEIYLDKNKTFFKALNLSTTPYIMLIDEKGKVVYSHTGYTPGGEMEIIEQIEKLKK